MNVLISVNNLYLDKAKTMLHSMHRNNCERTTVYLMNHCLSKGSVQRFREYLQHKLNMTLIEIDVSKTELDHMPLGNAHFSIEMYYRILAQFLLPEDIDRILWLDADIIICRSLYKFYHQDFGGKYIIACPDAMNDSKEVSFLKEKLGLPMDHIYFNSGVLLLNLYALRMNTCIEMIVRTAHELADRLTYPDQDLLNYLYKDKIKYCNWEEYNYQVHEKKYIEKEMLDKIVILHYAGDIKPWNFYHISQASSMYWKEIIKRKKWWTILVNAVLLGAWKVYIHCKIWVVVAKMRLFIGKYKAK